LRANEYGVYKFLEKSSENRADPTSQGHVTLWYEIGWIRAFLICCLLTLFGFLPGVLFAAGIGCHHLLKYWSS
jgi:hypothetical protein